MTSNDYNPILIIYHCVKKILKIRYHKWLKHNLNYPPCLGKMLKFTHLKWLKINLNYPPWLEKFLKFTHLKQLKIHFNYPPWLEKNLKFTKSHFQGFSRGWIWVFKVSQGEWSPWVCTTVRKRAWLPPIFISRIIKFYISYSTAVFFMVTFRFTFSFSIPQKKVLPLEALKA